MHGTSGSSSGRGCQKKIIPKTVFSGLEFPSLQTWILGTPKGLCGLLQEGAFDQLAAPA
jgi:hypothetical protein